MKLLIASDIHGSAFWCERLTEAFRREGAERLLLLGDVLYHGPRNPLPEEYAPMHVAEMLNGIKDKLVVVRGNCDSAVDGMISEFGWVEEALLLVGNTKIYCTHGHVYNKDALPPLPNGAVLAYGHFHRVMCEEVGGVTVVNPGSISLPHDGHHAYIVVDEKGLTIRTLDGEMLKEKRFVEN